MTQEHMGLPSQAQGRACPARSREIPALGVPRPAGDKQLGFVRNGT
jgi:hypothetical protein